jgi:hypothetical protein
MAATRGFVPERFLVESLVEPAQPVFAGQAGDFASRCISEHGSAQQFRKLDRERNFVDAFFELLLYAGEFPECYATRRIAAPFPE